MHTYSHDVIQPAHAPGMRAECILPDVGLCWHSQTLKTSVIAAELMLRKELVHFIQELQRGERTVVSEPRSSVCLDLAIKLHQDATVAYLGS